jgi:hypothetical protein
MMPVDADGYKDLLLDVDYNHHQDNKQNPSNTFISRDISSTSIKSKTTETTIC